jgi:lysophospholipase L1-like esterase
MEAIGRSMVLAVAAVVMAGCAVGAPAADASEGALRRLPLDPSAALLYVALGDSTVEGVGATDPSRNYVGQLQQKLRAVYSRARVENLGVGGATAAGVLRRQLPRALELRPDLVTLSVGPNDITGERAPGDYARDVETILQALIRRTGAVVVVNLIPDMTVTPRFRGTEVEPLVRQRVITFNEILADRARAHGAELVDLYSASQQEVPRRPGLVGPDRYHPSDEGYARWAELMWVGVRARMSR